MPANATTDHDQLERDILTDWLDVDRTMPTNATLTLNRSGAFTLRVAGDAHCGIVPPGAPPEVACTYALKLTCLADGLDANGFLVEQVGIDRFFQRLPKTGLSCEKLCVRVARVLYRRIMAENPNCKIVGMALTISPQPPAGVAGGAGMTFEWRPTAVQQAQRQRPRQQQRPQRERRDERGRFVPQNN